jgi:hypothetical protein
VASFYPAFIGFRVYPAFIGIGDLQSTYCCRPARWLYMAKLNLSSCSITQRSCREQVVLIDDEMQKLRAWIDSSSRTNAGVRFADGLSYAYV